MLARAAIALCIPAWFVTVRSVIFYFFLGAPDDRFSWWWTWFMALPASVASAVLGGLILYGIGWVVFGEGASDEVPHHPHSLPRHASLDATSSLPWYTSSSVHLAFALAVLIGVAIVIGRVLAS